MIKESDRKHLTEKICRRNNLLTAAKLLWLTKGNCTQPVKHFAFEDFNLLSINNERIEEKTLLSEFSPPIERIRKKKVNK